MTTGPATARSSRIRRRRSPHRRPPLRLHRLRRSGGSNARRNTRAGELGGAADRGDGETVGEAKWQALRELERMLPGLDKSRVRFQVVSEGERGLLGVGYTPARVVASVAEDAVETAGREG